MVDNLCTLYGLAFSYREKGDTSTFSTYKEFQIGIIRTPINIELNCILISDLFLMGLAQVRGTGQFKKLACQLVRQCMRQLGKLAHQLVRKEVWQLRKSASPRMKSQTLLLGSGGRVTTTLPESGTEQQHLHQSQQV